MTLIRPVATYGAESWTLNKVIVKWMATFGRKVLKGMFEGIKVNEYWRKRYNKELTQLFGDLDILSFVRKCRLNWIGHVNRMDSKRKVSQVFNREDHYEDDQKTDGAIVYKQILVKAQLQIGRRSQKTQLTGKSPLRRGRSMLDCNAIKEEEEEYTESGVQGEELVPATRT